MRKKILLPVLILAFIFIPAIIAHSAAEEEKARLLVIPLKAKGGVSEDEAALLTDILSTEIYLSGKFTILNREDMKSVLDEKEFELAMGCDDNVCLLENVSKLSVNKIITGNIGKLGKKYILSVRMINEDGENEMMGRESCVCEIDELDGTVEKISHKFLKYLGGNVAEDESILAESKQAITKWNDWQGNMSWHYIKNEGMDKGNVLNPSEKVQMWQGFLSEYSTDNPYSTEDQLMRNNAMDKLYYWKNYKEPAFGGAASINLRSSSRTLSVSQVQSMPNMSIREKNKWGFYGHSTVSHSYKKRSISGDSVVVDQTTGLMWHQSGSDKYMTWNDATGWVKKLNSRGCAGFNDWRLPTVEEAASLLESKKSNGRYIDPVFSKKQMYIWTGDKNGSEGAWHVDFYDGQVRWGYIISNRKDFVR
ncbi:MAG: DUF1566 domain-containing protein, partial [Colwellia sp.]|nr:DUF1566 domain-containing protein [Colwellia sp.]